MFYYLRFVAFFIYIYDFAQCLSPQLSYRLFIYLFLSFKLPLRIQLNSPEALTISFLIMEGSRFLRSSIEFRPAALEALQDK